MPPLPGSSIGGRPARARALAPPHRAGGGSPAAPPRRGAGGRRGRAASRRSVESTRWSAPARRSAAATSSRSAAAASAKRRRTLRRLVLTCSWRPVSGSTSQRSPIGVSSSSRGSRISTASTPWRARSARSGALPVALAAEVRDDDDQPAGAGHARPSRRPRRRARSRPRRRPRARARSSASSCSRPRRPWRGRSTFGAPPPNATTPSRLPRRVATWPIASATPSATSALRRSAVPNVIEAETSSTSQAVSARSPTCTRTCGSCMRAVTFQSMWRTSSPGRYGRIIASSVPAPTCGVRCSPGTRLSTRRRTARSSERRTAGGTGPGPGRSGVRSTVGIAAAAHGSRPPRAIAATMPTSSSARPPPANAAVTSCFSCRVARRVPRLR